MHLSRIVPVLSSVPCAAFVLLPALTGVGCGTVLGLEDTSAGQAGASGASAQGGAAGVTGQGGTGGSPSAACLPPKKQCTVDGADRCVSVEDINHGCTVEGCVPCKTPAHTTIVCVNHACAAGACAPGWGDCDGQVTYGCETDLNTNPHNCGACGKNCYETVINVGTVACEAGKCTYDHCSPGFDDCDNDPSTGCETNIWNLDRCGSCDAGPCTSSGGSPSCSNGTCHVSCASPGWATCKTDCDTNIAVDMDNCGACNRSCRHDNGKDHAKTECKNGSCILLSCIAPWDNCDNNLTTWCETNTSTDANHCGSCTGCSDSQVKTRACENGMCKPVCAPGYADCNGPLAGKDDDGCETALNTVTACGSCETSCAISHGTPKCAQAGGSYYCAIESCTAPWKDCNGDIKDGCEINTNANLKHCGACNTSCPASAVKCMGGKCIY